MSIKSTPLSISTGSFYDLGIQTEDCIELIQEMGLTEVEVFIQSPQEMDRDFIIDLNGRCTDSGISISSIHPHIYGFENLLYSQYPRQAIWAWDQYSRYLEICQTLNVNSCVVHGPPRHFAIGSEAKRQRYVTIMNKLVSCAQSFSVKLCIENVSYGLIRSVEDAIWHLKETNVPLVLDFKSAWKADLNPQDFISALGTNIAYSHVSFFNLEENKYGTCSKTQDCQPEVKEALLSLRSYIPSSDVVIEVFDAKHVADVRRSVEAIRGVLL